MLAKNIIIACSIAFSSFASAAPAVLSKRAVTVNTDTGSTSINPAIATTVVQGGTVSLDDIGGKADAAGAVADVINKVVQLVQGLVDADIKRRQRFTQETVSAVSVQFPGMSVVMSNVGYTITGTPLTVQKTSYKAKVGSNVSYDVLVFGAGSTFTLNGDGGFENWAYVTRSPCKANGKTITC
ncbi:hypothetical protein B0J14DRAFT_672993 [Halenospora varia]|nr:hypothetical protein B0J14DRAFT_672993 [Halenospora varia]